PFSGSTVSQATSTLVGDCFDDVEYTVAGEASVLGHFTGVGHQRVSYCGGGGPGGGAAPPDQPGHHLDPAYVGVRQGDLSSYLVSAIITGGTGAFQGVTGSATLTIADYSPSRPFDAFIDGTLLLESGWIRPMSNEPS